jgi:hypothetical protein
MQGVQRMRYKALMAAVLVATVCGSLASGPSISAQTPTPSWWMEDSRPGNGWVTGQNAQVVEGLGVLGGCSYSESSIEDATVNDINNQLQVVTEITP